MTSTIQTVPLEEAASLPTSKLFTHQRMDPKAFLFNLLGWRVALGAALVVGCVLPWYAAAAAAALLLAAPLVRSCAKALGVRPPASFNHPDDVPVIHSRFTAQSPPDGSLCIFLIGVRFNAGFPFTGKDAKWAGEAMASMLRELEGSDPEVTGFLGVERFQSILHGSTLTMDLQYWRSHEHVVKYAQSQMNKHASAWRRMFEISKASPALGIWHESYQVAGGIDTVYSNMPPVGLSRALGAQAAVGRMMTSRNRMGLAKNNDWPTELDVSKELY